MTSKFLTNIHVMNMWSKMLFFNQHFFVALSEILYNNIKIYNTCKFKFINIIYKLILLK